MTNCEQVGLEHRWTEDGVLCSSCGLVRKPPTACECDKDAYNPPHAAGHCPGVAYYSVVRDGQRINVCPDCRLSSDTDSRKLSEQKEG